jgi:leader peptidase (prepilin peptidase)/N-methyltransferase
MIEAVYAFIVGACIGSFLNVCIYRLPKNISLIRPPSFCPRCNTAIKWFDNIPILSYLMLKARCRHCRQSISLRYPLVEFITGCLFFSLYQQFFLSLPFFKYAFLFSLLIVVSLIDIEYRAIPAYLCFIGIIVGFCFILYEPTIRYLSAETGKDALYLLEDYYHAARIFLKNIIFGFGFAYLFKFFSDVLLNLYLALRKKESIEGEKEALGLGDVDFMGMVAVFLGPQTAVLTFFLAPFIALGYSLCALLFRRSHIVPYLPYLSIATFISFIWGENLLKLFII